MECEENYGINVYILSVIFDDYMVQFFIVRGNPVRI